MGKTKNKNVKQKFSKQELGILHKICSTIQDLDAIKYNQLTNRFNKQCSKQLTQFKERSPKAVQIMIKKHFKIQKHYWDKNLESMMFQFVKQGLRWKKISEQPEFYERQIKIQDIKRRFESVMRSKFSILFKSVNQQSESPKISDLVYKAIVQNKIIQKLCDSNLIIKQQAQCLLGSISIFTSSIYQDEQEYGIRSNKFKNNFLSLFSEKISKRLLVDTILKLQQIFKKLPKNFFCFINNTYEDESRTTEISTQLLVKKVNNRRTIKISNQKMHIQNQKIENDDQKIKFQIEQQIQGGDYDQIFIEPDKQFEFIDINQLTPLQIPSRFIDHFQN